MADGARTGVSGEIFVSDGCEVMTLYLGSERADRKGREDGEIASWHDVDDCAPLIPPPPAGGGGWGWGGRGGGGGGGFLPHTRFSAAVLYPHPALRATLPTRGRDDSN